MKKNIKLWLYPLVGVVSGAALFAVCYWALHLDMVYSIFYGILAAGVAFLVTRGIIHIVKKELTKAFTATTVWGVLACLLWTWLILNTSSAVQTTLVFGILSCVLCFVGFELWGKKGEEYLTEVVEVESKKEKIKRLATELKYQMDGETPLLDHPLCEIDGVAYTPAEADAMGYGAIAANGIEYIKKYVKEGK
jgi:uncharacterized protein YacL